MQYVSYKKTLKKHVEMETQKSNQTGRNDTTILSRIAVPTSFAIDTCKADTCRANF